MKWHLNCHFGSSCNWQTFSQMPIKFEWHLNCIGHIARYAKMNQQCQCQFTIEPLSGKHFLATFHRVTLLTRFAWDFPPALWGIPTSIVLQLLLTLLSHKKPFRESHWDKELSVDLLNGGQDGISRHRISGWLSFDVPYAHGWFADFLHLMDGENSPKETDKYKKKGHWPQTFLDI